MNDETDETSLLGVWHIGNPTGVGCTKYQEGASNDTVIPSVACKNYKTRTDPFPGLCEYWSMTVPDRLPTEISVKTLLIFKMSIRIFDWWSPCAWPDLLTGCWASDDQYDLYKCQSFSATESKIILNLINNNTSLSLPSCADSRRILDWRCTGL